MFSSIEDVRQVRTDLIGLECEWRTSCEVKTDWNRGGTSVCLSFCEILQNIRHNIQNIGVFSSVSHTRRLVGFHRVGFVSLHRWFQSVALSASEMHLESILIWYTINHQILMHLHLYSNLILFLFFFFYISGTSWCVNEFRFLK